MYSAALDAGFTAASVLTDEPMTFVDRHTHRPWVPRNFRDQYFGPVLFRTALVKSLNLATVRLADEIGIQAVVDRARAMGLEGSLPPYLSVSLGSSDVTLLNLCRAYSTFARGGSHVRPRLVLSVKDGSGRELYHSDVEAVDAITPQNAFVVTSLLKEVVQSGTATACRELGRPVAGKTGTTNDEKDAWFIGFTPYLLTGVWVGFDNPSAAGSVGPGGRVAAPIWLKYRLAVESSYPVEDFPPPPGVEFRQVDGPAGDGGGAAAATYRLPFVAGSAPARKQ